MQEYMIKIVSEKPPKIMLGENIGGGIVKELKEVAQELVTASQLAALYNLSVNTIRDKLVSINQGTTGKGLYNPRLAHELLTQKSKKGRPRAN
ncbi:DNA-binding protein [Acinetobacter sp. ME22]|uniref:DNA-binding protein n=1 Tax=Acinetobacter sp. ME22 TaxID=2904802 RepID=UPI001EDA4307|nr:DNA-binding protein [Acinetobacter sp. ME22]MCG2572432.1 DNA-binding protein [Acinetobacter sp. ME22]